MLTSEQKHALKVLVKGLNKLADYADRYDIMQGNGGYVGSLLGSMADDLEQQDLDSN
jgi:hypothetical protein